MQRKPKRKIDFPGNVDYVLKTFLHATEQIVCTKTFVTL